MNGEPERRSRDALPGAGLAIGAGLGGVIGMLVAGAPGLALGAAIGAGLGLTFGAAARGSSRDGDRTAADGSAPPGGVP